MWYTIYFQADFFVLSTEDSLSTFRLNMETNEGLSGYGGAITALKISQSIFLANASYSDLSLITQLLGSSCYPFYQIAHILKKF
jgi:hypothetical protein